MSWKNWGDHPVVVAIGALSALCAIIGAGYVVYDNISASNTTYTPIEEPGFILGNENEGVISADGEEKVIGDSNAAVDDSPGGVSGTTQGDQSPNITNTDGNITITYGDSTIIESAKKEGTTLNINNFVGLWTSQGVVGAKHFLELDISTRDTKLVGALKSRNLVNGSSSGIISFVGEIEGEYIAIEIFDQQAFEIGEAELSLGDEALVWRLSRAQGGAERTLPSLAYLFKTDKLSF